MIINVIFPYNLNKQTSLKLDKHSTFLFSLTISRVIYEMWTTVFVLFIFNGPLFEIISLLRPGLSRHTTCHLNNSRRNI